MNRVLAFLPGVLLAALIAVAIFVLLRPGERQTVTADGLIGRPAPAFELARLSGGEPVSSTDFAGRAYIINVWASWCTPCRAEHPRLMRLKEQGVVIIGVDYKDEETAGAAFLATLGDPFAAVGRDPQGRFSLELGVAGAVPETFVVGRDGTIVAVHRGPLTQDDIDRVILPAYRRSS